MIVALQRYASWSVLRWPDGRPVPFTQALGAALANLSNGLERDGYELHDKPRATLHHEPCARTVIVRVEATVRPIPGSRAQLRAAAPFN